MRYLASVKVFGDSFITARLGKQSASMNCIRIKKQVIHEMEQFFLSQDHEQGCLLGCSEQLDQIDRVCIIPGVHAEESFVPDIELLNKQLIQWESLGVCFGGFVHSHIGGGSFVSMEDQETIRRWTQASELPFLCFGVALVSCNDVHLKFYIANNDRKDITIIGMEEVHSLDESNDFAIWREQT